VPWIVRPPPFRTADSAIPAEPHNRQELIALEPFGALAFLRLDLSGRRLADALTFPERDGDLVQCDPVDGLLRVWDGCATSEETEEGPARDVMPEPLDRRAHGGLLSSKSILLGR
jgi:hypothetical protein